MKNKNQDKKKISKIQKRNGDIVPYQKSKIVHAIFKAAQSIGGKSREKAYLVADQVEKNIIQKFSELRIPKVEEIQDEVEKVLIELGHAKTAKAYILYRDLHSKIRDIKSLVDTDELIESYVEKSDWQIKENANMSYSLHGLNYYISKSVQKNYWLNKIYSKRVRDAEKNGDLHVHDLDMIAVYCCGWDLKDLLLRGFTGVEGKVSCAAPKHLRVALGQIVNFFYTLQHEANGAQAFSSFDTYLAPFVRYDRLSYQDVKQAIQEFVFNINVPTRVGFQTPFTNITMDLKVPKIMKDDPVIIGGKYQKETYSEFQPEVDMINEAFAEVMLEGDAQGRVFTFPIPTYNITKDFDWENTKLKALWEMTSKYGIPYFANYVNSDMDPEDARSMCCRLRLDNRELRKRGGGLFGSNPLTGSIGVVTLNLARIGYLARTKKDFFSRLDTLMDIAKESLVTKRKVLEKYTRLGLYPYSRVYLEGVNKRFGEYWKNHFNTIGILGMNEACLNFWGTDIGQEKGKGFAMELMEHMRLILQKFQEETGDMFNLEATPGEGTCYRFAITDKEKYPDIIVANEDDYQKKNADPYYSNSTQLPVDYTEDMFDVLDHQDIIQTKYTGGTVQHLYLGEKINDYNITKELVRKISGNYRLPYFSITPTFSICPRHGYISGEHNDCPQCDEKCEVYSRVVGFLRPVSQWSEGKVAEFNQRKYLQYA